MASQRLKVLNRTKGSCLGENVTAADTTLARMVGLLRTKSLAPGCGLFIFPTQAVHTIGMRYPIDVIFIDKRNRVVGVREALPPLRLTRIFWTAQAAIEVPAHTARETRTEVGDELELVFEEAAT